MREDIETLAIKPIVTPDPDSEPFFDGAAQGKLMLRRCKACDAWHTPAAQFCMECLSSDLEWVQASGHAHLHSFTIIHRGQINGLDVPYNVAIVETKEGPRMTSQVHNCSNHDLQVDMALRLVVKRLTNGLHLPYFEPAISQSDRVRTP